MLAIEMIKDAIYSHVGMDIRYEDARGRVTERSILPYSIIETADQSVQYVWAYCHLRRARRVFRVDRFIAGALRSQKVTIKEYTAIAKRFGIAGAKLVNGRVLYTLTPDDEDS